ncbi:DEKNAAC100662 [Brettanomyces naardenensis]|uniref:DEKNAAC100662 n=1 Tax=Brettanomyces naardenensis TaxID=13370 RepID=A0A448YGC7_BRENA|nr:DEKNAAC100662 [Brettanomyces naardenensis]
MSEIASVASSNSDHEVDKQSEILEGTSDINKVEAPITIKTYLMCAFAAFGGIFFGYDSGYISGVLGMKYFITQFTGKVKGTIPDSQFVIPASQKSLIVSILSLGTFIGAVSAGDLADWYGRKTIIISGCVVYSVGAILQIASTSVPLLVVGRLVAGVGMGFVSAVVILYMSEISPRKVRGTVVSGYQFSVSLGLVLASVVDYATQNRNDSGSYRIPMGIQLLWCLTLGVGMLFLPESPRYFVRKRRIDKARKVLAILRGQDYDSPYITDELAEIIANHEIEEAANPAETYWGTWALCFKGSLRSPASNIRRTILGTSLQMMQQWTGINFIFYFSTTFFQQLGTIKNEFLMTVITTLINLVFTPVSFYLIEKFGRRHLLIWGAAGMCICEFIVAIVGTINSQDQGPVKVLISFICIYVFFFALSWGPGAWVMVGEVFSLSIRSRGVGLSTASNWLWNCIIAVITPFMVDTDKGDMGPKVFFVWGSLCGCCILYAYLLLPETKGLTLEQVDQMLAESTPRTSTKWRPHQTFASQLGVSKEDEKAEIDHIENAGTVDMV